MAVIDLKYLFIRHSDNATIMNIPLYSLDTDDELLFTLVHSIFKFKIYSTPMVTVP